MAVMTDLRRLSVELDPGDDPIRGRLSTAAGRVSPFTGWIGLLRVLEEAIAPPAGPEPDQTNHE